MKLKGKCVELASAPPRAEKPTAKMRKNRSPKWSVERRNHMLAVLGISWQSARFSFWLEAVRVKERRSWKGKMESFEQDGRQSRTFVLEGRRSKRIHGRTQLLELWRQRTSQIRVELNWWASVPSSGPLRESTSIGATVATYDAKSAFPNCVSILSVHPLLLLLAPRFKKCAQG